MKRHNHQQWFKARRQLMRKIRLQVAHLLGSQGGDLGEYSGAYKREFRGNWSPGSKEQLMLCVQEADFVFGADFHAFAQAQRTHLRLLRRLHSPRPLVLALECIESRHQKDVDLFMAGSLTEKAFLKRVQWDKRWGFPWSYYKPLFKLAQDRGIRVLALNRFEARRTLKGLARRDRHAARILVDYKSDHPKALIYVIYGDLHLASPHLPKELVELSEGSKPKIVTIFQNVEELYFRLAAKGLETQVEVLSSSRDRFCILGSPPWVKWQSYLIYLEQAYDRDLEDVDEDDLGVDYTDHIHSLIQLIGGDLGVKLKIYDLAVYLPSDELVYTSLETSVSAVEMKLIQHLMANDRSFYLPHMGLLYLSRETVNHAATLAGQYVHSKLNGSKSWFWRQPQEFYQRIWIEAVGFFLSKLVNHRRKADAVRDLKAQLAASQPKDKGRDSLLLALDQRLSEVIYVYSGRRRQSKFSPRQKNNYFEAAKILGGMMGERLYLSYRAQRIAPSTLLKILKKNPEDEDFSAFYLSMVKRLESQSLLPSWTGDL